MKTYYIRFTKTVDEETRQLVLSARGPKGKVMALASGETLEEATAQLKLRIAESLAAVAESGGDPLVLLGFGRVPAEAAVFSAKDLLPALLRLHRKAQGLTQEEVAERLGVSQPSYAKYERWGANPRIETVESLGRALGVPLISIWRHD